MSIAAKQTSQKTESLKLGILHRAMDVDRANLKEESRTLTVSGTSETPVERWFGNEILSHDPSAVDFSRVIGKGAVLRDHDTRQHVGVIERAWLEKGRTHYDIRFSKSAAGEQEMQDMKDGIRTLMSAGYRINKIELVSEADGVKTYRATKWQILELSTVAVPADDTVGYGRSNQHDQNDMRILHDSAPAEGNGTTAKPGAAAGVVEIDQTKRSLDILEMAEAYKAKVSTADATRFIKEGKSTDEFREFILKRYGATPVGQIDPDIGMTDKEVRNYSLVRAIAQLANGRPLDGIEKEASDAVAKQMRKQPQGFFVPSDISTRSFQKTMDLGPAQMASLVVELSRMLSQRGLNATTLTAGGYLIQTDLLASSMIELLQNNMVMNKLGATMLTGLQGDVAIPSETGDVTAYWLSEVAAVTESQKTFGQILLTPHRLSAACAYSKQLLAQSSIDIEAFVRNNLMRKLALGKDLAALNGSGVAGQPLGIMNTTGLGSITYGGAPTWAKVVENETTLGTANALGIGTPAFVSSFATQGKWKSTPKVSAQGVMLIENGLANGYRFEATTQMPAGDKTIFGQWSELIIADWDSGIDVVVDPYSLSLTAQIRVVVNLMTDIGVKHPAAFVLSTDSGAQ